MVHFGRLVTVILKDWLGRGWLIPRLNFRSCHYEEPNMKLTEPEVIPENVHFGPFGCPVRKGRLYRPSTMARE